jgi:hypothetical protein
MMRKIMGAVMAALMATLLVVQPMMAATSGLAAPEGEQVGERYLGFHCVDNVCRAELDLGIGSDWLPSGAWLTVMKYALRQLPGGLGIELQDDVTITLPTGNLSLADANLTLTLDESGKVIAMRGSAAAPVPTFGLLGDWQVVTPARVTVGYDLGKELVALNAPLQPERRYFFMDAEAGLHLITNGLELTSDAGQRATLVVDFAQPMLFVDGRVTLHTDGQMAFIREALGPLGESSWMPTDLPLRQSVQVHVQGQLGREVEPKLTLAGEYRMDGGMIGKWLQLDATPLLARGQATIGPEGVVLEGQARSALKPNEWFDGGAQAQLFVPFDAPETAALSVGADVASPVMDVEQSATATLAGESGWLERTGEAAWTGVQQGWNQVGTVVQNGYASLGESLSDGLESGWAGVQSQWCGLTGLCAEEGTAVAAAK